MERRIEDGIAPLINLEATKDTNSNLTSEKEPIYPDKKNNINHNNLRIKIPVIPYNK